MLYVLLSESSDPIVNVMTESLSFSSVYPILIVHVGSSRPYAASVLSSDLYSRHPSYVMSSALRTDDKSVVSVTSYASPPFTDAFHTTFGTLSPFSSVSSSEYTSTLLSLLSTRLLPSLLARLKL